MGRGILILRIKDLITDLSLSRRAIDRVQKVLSETGSRIIDWSLEENLSKMIVIVDTPSEDIIELLGVVESNIRAVLEQHGIGTETEIKASIDGLEVDRDLMFKLLWLRNISSILDAIVLIDILQDLKLAIGTISSFVNEKFAQECAKLYEIASRDRRIKDILSQVSNSLKRISKRPPLGICSAITVLGEVEGMPKEDFLEKYLIALHLFSIDKLETVETLERFGLLARDEVIQLTEEGRRLHRDLSKLMKSLLLKVEEKKELTEAFREINKKMKFIVLRDGRFDEFKSQKILESLVRAGIDVDISIRSIDRFLSFLPLDIVSSEYLLRSISRELMLYDPSGRSSSFYEFYMETGRYVIIKVDNTERIFTFKLVRGILKGILKPLILDVPSYVEDEIVERVYETIRMLASLSAQKAVPLREYYSIEIEEGLLKTLCREGLRLSIVTPDLLDEGIDQKIILLRARGLLMQSMDELRKTTLSSWGYRSFIRGLFYISSALMILMNILPGTSLIANLSVLLSRLEEYRKGTIKPMVDIREDLGRITHLLKSTYRVVHRETVDKNILRLALRLSGKLIHAIDHVLKETYAQAG